MALTGAIKLIRKMLDHLQQDQVEESIDSELYKIGWAAFASTWPTELAERRLAQPVPPLVPPVAAPAGVSIISPCSSRCTSPSLGTNQEEEEDDSIVVSKSSLLDARLFNLAVNAEPPPRQLFIVRSMPTGAALNKVVTIPRDSNTGNIFTVYNRGFEFNMDVDLANVDEWSTCVRKIPIVLYFNARLCHHFKATRNASGCCSVDELEQALDYYQCAFACVRNVASRDRSDLEWSILVMGLLNNMGHCFFALNQTNQAMVCLKRLRLAYERSSQRNRLYREELSFFEAMRRVAAAAFSGRGK